MGIATQEERKTEGYDDFDYMMPKLGTVAAIGLGLYAAGCAILVILALVL